MVTAALERASRVQTRSLTFVDTRDSSDTPADASNETEASVLSAVLRAPDRIRVRAQPVPLDHLDATIETLAKHYGHDYSQVRGLSLAVAVGDDVGGKQRTWSLALNVRRDGKTNAFVARSQVTRAFGYGETIAEAVRDCLADFSHRSQVLLSEQERLARGPEAELRDLRRWRTSP